MDAVSCKPQVGSQETAFKSRKRRHISSVAELFIMGKNQRFHNPDIYYIENAKSLLVKAVEQQRITQRDKELISEFIDENTAISQLSAIRRYKLTVTLIKNRYYLPEYSACTIGDIYSAIGKIKDAKKENGDPKYSAHTISDMIREVKRFSRWLSTNNYSEISLSKIEKIKVPRGPSITVTPDKILTEEEIVKIIEACNTTRDRALMSVLYEGGFRIGEIGNLTWGDIVFNEWNVTARTSEKTGKERFVPLISSRPYLSQWKEDYPLPITPDAFVFLTTNTHKPLHYEGLLKQIRVITTRAGITKYIKPHVFRHSRITHLIKNGMPESHVKMMMWGDVNSDMLRNYLHLEPKEIAARLAEMNGIKSTETAEEEKKKKRVTPQQCKICATLNSPTAMYCSNCGTPLGEEGKSRLQSIEGRVRDRMLEDPEFMLMLAVSMKKLDEEKLQTIKGSGNE